MFEDTIYYFFDNLYSLVISNVIKVRIYQRQQILTEIIYYQYKAELIENIWIWQFEFSNAIYDLQPQKCSELKLMKTV